MNKEIGVFVPNELGLSVPDCRISGRNETNKRRKLDLESDKLPLLCTLQSSKIPPLFAELTPRISSGEGNLFLETNIFETTRSSAWNNLPDDVLRRIVDHLPSYSHRIIRVVCKSWFQALNRSLQYVRPEQLQPSRLLSLSFPNLRILDLSFCDSTLHMTSSHQIRFESRVSDDSLLHLSGLNHLKQLILCHCKGIVGHGLAHVSLIPSLEHIDLTGCVHLTNEGLKAGLSGLQYVHALTLLDCTRVTDDGVALLASLPALQRVAVPPKTTDQGLKFLALSPPLQRVAIRDCPDIGPRGIFWLATHAPHLKRVVISRCPRVTADALDTVKEAHLSVMSCSLKPKSIPTTYNSSCCSSCSSCSSHKSSSPQFFSLSHHVLPPDLQLLMTSFHD